MRVAFALIAAAVCLASPALAEDCDFAGPYVLWTAVNQDVDSSSCTEGADDNYNIPTGVTVVVGADLTLTSGSITVSTGGTLIHPGGRTLNPGVRLYVTGGTYEPQGQVLSVSRVTEEPNFGGTTVAVNIGVSTAGFADTDMLVFLDEDPEPGTVIKGCVHPDAGVPVDTGCYRPAHEKWRWYDIASRSGDAITYNLTESVAGFAATQAPYTGTRTDDTAITVASMVLQRYGLATAVTVDIGTAAIDADFGDMQLYFPERDLDDDEEHNLCSGHSFEVLYTEEAGASADVIYVKGDTTKCNTTANPPILTHGVRRGDMVAVVRPAVLDGEHDAHLVWDDGYIRAQWARFFRLSFGDLVTDFAPDLSRSCNICIIEKAAGNGPDGGYFRDVDIAWSESDQTDTVPLYFDSTMGTGEARFTGSTLDVSTVEFRRLYVHDTIDDVSVAGGGTHGIWVDQAKGVLIQEARLERGTDDGFGGIMSSVGGAIPVGNATFVSIIDQANIAFNNNSQEGLSFVTAYHGVGASQEAVLSQGTVDLIDVVVRGCHRNCVNTALPGILLNRAQVSGSHFNGSGNSDYILEMSHGTAANVNCSASGVPVASCTGSGTGTGTFPALMVDSYPSKLKNALVAVYGTAITAGENCFPRVSGDIENSVIWGNQQRACTGGRLNGAKSIKRTFADLDGGPANGAIGGMCSSTGSISMSSLTLEDSVFVSSDSVRLGREYDLTVTSLSLTRVMTLMGAGDTNGPLHTISQSPACGGSAPATVTVNDHWSSSLSGPAAQVYGVTNGSGITGRICMNSTVTSLSGQPANATMRITNATLKPDADTDTRLRAFTRRATQTLWGGCETPHALGLSELSVAHLNGSSGLVRQIDAYSSSDLIYTSEKKPSLGGGS